MFMSFLRLVRPNRRALEWAIKPGNQKPNTAEKFTKPTRSTHSIRGETPMTKTVLRVFGVAIVVTAMTMASAFAGGLLCGGQSHEVSVPTETVSTDGPVTVAESGTQETQ